MAAQRTPVPALNIALGDLAGGAWRRPLGGLKLYLFFLLIVTPILGLAQGPIPISIQRISSTSIQPSSATDDHRMRLDRGSTGAIFRITPTEGAWPEGNLVVRLKGSLRGNLQLSIDGNAVSNWDPTGSYAYHGAAFPLPDLKGQTTALMLTAPPFAGIESAVQISVIDRNDFQKEDVQWLVLVCIQLGMMAAMMMMALTFFAVLGRPVYLAYGAYLFFLAVTLLLQFGLAQSVIGIPPLDPTILIVGRLAAAGAVTSASLFAIRFTDMALYAPFWRRLVLIQAGLFLGVVCFSIIPIAALQNVFRAAINPLLLVGTPLVAVASFLTWRRGSRYAGYFLVGWIPLLVVSALDAAATENTTFLGWSWLGDSLLWAASFETVVFAAGMGERSLTMQRELRTWKRISDVDPLTGLLNRRSFLETASKDAHHAARWILFVDLDNFKMLNDHSGHRAGDEALIQVARTFLMLGAELSACRYGGEEFVALFDAGDRQGALEIAEQLRFLIHELNIPAGGDRVLTASIGVAMCRPGVSLDVDIERADEAMYRAKSKGRNRVEFEA